MISIRSWSIRKDFHHAIERIEPTNAYDNNSKNNLRSKLYIFWIYLFDFSELLRSRFGLVGLYQIRGLPLSSIFRFILRRSSVADITIQANEKIHLSLFPVSFIEWYQFREESGNKSTLTSLVNCWWISTFFALLLLLRTVSLIFQINGMEWLLFVSVIISGK